jgi:hypothetical protein
MEAGRIPQGIPMPFRRFDEDKMEAALMEYRKKREKERERELSAAQEV